MLPRLNHLYSLLQLLQRLLLLCYVAQLPTLRKFDLKLFWVVSDPRECLDQEGVLAARLLCNNSHLGRQRL